MNELLDDFIPRSQSDRMALATYQMLEEINENLKKLAPQKTAQTGQTSMLELIDPSFIMTGPVIDSSQIENEQGEVVKPKSKRKPKTEVSE